MTRMINWTEVQELRDQGVTDTALARRLGITAPTIRVHCGLRGDHIFWAPKDDEYLRAHYKRDKSAAEIGAHLGFTRNSVIGRAFRLLLSEAAA